MSTGLRLRALDQDADRVSVQSSHQSSHLLTRRKFPVLPAKWTPVTIERDELLVLKCNHGTTAIDVKHVGGSDGAVILDDCGQKTILREGSVVRMRLRRDSAIFLRTQSYTPPSGKGARFLSDGRSA